MPGPSSGTIPGTTHPRSLQCPLQATLAMQWGWGWGCHWVIDNGCQPCPKVLLVHC